MSEKQAHESKYHDFAKMFLKTFQSPSNQRIADSSPVSEEEIRRQKKKAEKSP